MELPQYGQFLRPIRRTPPPPQANVTIQPVACGASLLWTLARSYIAARDFRNCKNLPTPTQGYLSTPFLESQLACRFVRSSKQWSAASSLPISSFTSLSISRSSVRAANGMLGVSNHFSITSRCHCNSLLLGNFICQVPTSAWNFLQTKRFLVYRKLLEMLERGNSQRAIYPHLRMRHKPFNEVELDLPHQFLQ